jgi:excisionase family DNA binding protein
MATTTPHADMAIGEVAKCFGVTVGTVRNWELKGHLTSIRTPGGQRRFRRSDVEALLTAKESA